jgi:hypothetical protein
MVKCKRCFTQVDFKYVQPEIDKDGCFFHCPVCRHRNKLVSVGSKNGPRMLAQPED